MSRKRRKPPSTFQERRIAAGLSQQQVADEADVVRSAVSEYETDGRGARALQLERALVRLTKFRWEDQLLRKVSKVPEGSDGQG